MSAAKPFPSAIRIGADIAHIPRFEKLLRQRLRVQYVKPPTSSDENSQFYRHAAESLGYWAKRVLSRMEWPRFKFYMNLMVRNRRPGEDPDYRPLATWMASRWAAKEAAIKAHHNRDLYMPQISIIKRHDHPRPIMLIDPPNALVRMSAEVAQKRDINTNLADQKIDAKKLQHWQERGEVRKPFRDIKVPKEEEEQEIGKRGEDKQQQIYWRYRKVDMEQRQEANVTISHDGEYAFAAVQVLDETYPKKHQPIIFEDDGEGRAIHEPQYGDRMYAVMRPSFTYFANQNIPDGQFAEEEEVQADKYLGEYMEESAKRIFRHGDT